MKYIIYDLGVNYWMKNLADYADPNIKIVLVGNKSDIQDKRVIPLNIMID